MIVEIIGAPGVGKSTLVEQIKRQNNRLLSGIYETSLDHVRVPRNQYLAKVAEASRIAGVIGMVWGVRCLYYRFPKEEEKEAALTCMPQGWQRFKDFCDRMIADLVSHNEIMPIAGQWFLDALQMRALMELAKTRNRIALVDEPLSYRLSLFPNQASYQDYIRQYYNLMPLPDAVAYISADVETIAERYHGRSQRTGMINIRHQGMTHSEIHEDIKWAITIAETAVHSLKERGVAVLRLDATRSVDENAAVADTFMRSLFSEFRQT